MYCHPTELILGFFFFVVVCFIKFPNFIEMSIVLLSNPQEAVEVWQTDKTAHNKTPAPIRTPSPFNYSDAFPKISSPKTPASADDLPPYQIPSHCKKPPVSPFPLSLQGPTILEHLERSPVTDGLASRLENVCLDNDIPKEKELPNVEEKSPKEESPKEESPKEENPKEESPKEESPEEPSSEDDISVSSYEDSPPRPSKLGLESPILGSIISSFGDSPPPLKSMSPEMIPQKAVTEKNFPKKESPKITPAPSPGLPQGW